MNPFSLSGKTVLVTGANTGIGRATAIAMGRAGAAVICAGRRSSAKTLAEIPDGREILLDFSDPMAARDVFCENHIDILINNAGIIRRSDAVDFSEADWDDVVDINLKAVFFTTQAFARAVFERRGTGSVVNVASLLSFQGGIRVASYTAAKHGVAGVTKALANEWAASGINVNAIAPGYIATNNTEALRDDPDRNQAILDRIPAGRWGEPDDIGAAAVFLASPAAKYIHGAVLNVDGGWLAR
ncbi:2-dehydro-3-deoxy-D-gluconate 5-dehydrogenase KduD [Hoeflea ulvae]|uniref:2-dehydro-3-deoxy-D-gluconate 5-dehydrogenase KduD n=1 Tax=Hoeflea ulvae TaxID=2983764 RepID=A0ABT3YKA1_9HYPH|nr:2-dehydro-3-deoxy-D-gluconate 5-dehydrogenase KduD [Hoeflea ulvae]MCY0096321.1 2-dehydro-3-deoxy-D-gluconate 5-dehydrogenase KduD [Hoeflea ulvae]